MLNLLLSVAINLFIPFFGNLISSEAGRERVIYAILSAISAVIFFVPSKKDIVFASIYIYGSSILILTIYIAMASTSIVLILLKYRRSGNIEIVNIVNIFAVTSTALYFLASLLMTPRIVYVPAGYLSPYLNKNDILTYGLLRRPSINEYSIIKTQDGNLILGLWLGQAGDFVGRKDGRIVICRKENDINGCLYLDNICKNLEKERVLIKNYVDIDFYIEEGSVFLSTMLMIHSLEDARAMMRQFRSIWALDKVFYPGETASFGYRVQKNSCELDK